MSMTYSDATVERPDLSGQGAEARPYVPAYARHRHRSGKRVKTWMVLAPVGAVVLIGAGVLMVTGERPATGALVEATSQDAMSAPMLNTPVAPVATDTLGAMETAAMAEPVASVAQVAPAVAPVRRAAPAATVAAPAPVAAEPVEQTLGPRPYIADPTSPAATATPDAPAPDIRPQPLG